MKIKVVPGPSFQVDTVMIVSQLYDRQKHVEAERNTIRHSVAEALARKSQHNGTQDYESGDPHHSISSTVAIADEHTLQPQLYAAREGCIFELAVLACVQDVKSLTKKPARLNALTSFYRKSDFTFRNRFVKAPSCGMLQPQMIPATLRKKNTGDRLGLFIVLGANLFV